MDGSGRLISPRGLGLFALSALSAVPAQVGLPAGRRQAGARNKHIGHRLIPLNRKFACISHGFSEVIGHACMRPGCDCETAYKSIGYVYHLGREIAYSASARKTPSAASRVSSMESWVWARETKAASNWDGASATPSSSINR